MNTESIRSRVCHKTVKSQLCRLLSRRSYGPPSTHLLSGKAHVIPHVGENSGFDEEPLQAQSFASTLQLGSFADAALDVLQHAGLLLPTDLRGRYLKGFQERLKKGRDLWFK